MTSSNHHWHGVQSALRQGSSKVGCNHAFNCQSCVYVTNRRGGCAGFPKCSKELASHGRSKLFNCIKVQQLHLHGDSEGHPHIP